LLRAEEVSALAWVAVIHATAPMRTATVLKEMFNFIFIF
jgi:hypothetical protein